MNYKSEIKQLTKKRQADAGLDIASNETITINPHSRATIKTGLYLEIPFGFVGLLWSRSGLSAKHGIEVGAGCIDSEYRGEVKVVLYNHSDTLYTVKEGDRIAQLLTMPVNLSEYEKVDKLTETSRSSTGFGDSGK